MLTLTLETGYGSHTDNKSIQQFFILQTTMRQFLRTRYVVGGSDYVILASLDWNGVAAVDVLHVINCCDVWIVKSVVAWVMPFWCAVIVFFPAVITLTSSPYYIT